MKKLLALFLILLLMLSAFGCAKPDEETGAEAGLVDTPAPQPEKTPESEKEPATNEPTPDTQTKEPEKEEPETEEPQPTGDKTEQEGYIEFTINNDFSPYEIVVTLTVEESEKNQKYTAKDFENVDIFHVIEFNDYYKKFDYKSKEYSELNNKQTLFLYLNKPSKKQVLEYVDILKSDPRIEHAAPNSIEKFMPDRVVVDLKPEYENLVFSIADCYDNSLKKNQEIPEISKRAEKYLNPDEFYLYTNYFQKMNISQISIFNIKKPLFHYADIVLKSENNEENTVIDLLKLAANYNFAIEVRPVY